jgi:Fur family ferric uptake transcriptional regulator
MSSSTPKKQARLQEAGRLTPDSQTGVVPRPEENVLQRHIANHHLKVTREREVVLRAFLAAERHVSAEELHRQIREAGESIGLATVYRALNLFCECGLAEPRQFGDGFTRYEMTYNVRHHDHLICTQCHTIIEFENPDIEELQEKVARRNHFTVYRHKLEMYGLCQACVAVPKPIGHF